MNFHELADSLGLAAIYGLMAMLAFILFPGGKK